MLIDPTTVGIVIGAGLATYGIYSVGRYRATAPDSIVDMQEVHNYEMFSQAGESLRQDVEGGDGGGD